MIFGQFSTYFKVFLNSLYKFYAFIVKFGLFLQWYKAFFFPRGEIPGYRHTQRVQEIHLGTLLVKEREKEKDLGTGKTQSSIVHRHTNPVVKGKRSSARNTVVHSWWKERTIHRYITLTAKGKEYGTRRDHTAVRQGPIVRRDRQGPVQQSRQRPPPSGAGRDPIQASRDPHPARVPTRTSRRAGIGQGDLPHTKVTTSSSRMQGDRKDQHSSHSLNQWKERFGL